MSLYKRGDVWWSYLYIDGVRQQRSTGASNRRQAQQIELKFKEEANARRHELVRVDPNRTFADLSALFVAQAEPTPYHLDRLKMLLPFFGDTKLVKINKSITREYRKIRLAEKSIKDATINRDLAVLRHLLFWAVDEGLLAANPLGRLRLVRERKTYRRVLSVAEEFSLLDASAEHLADIVIAALDTGMRRGEILGQLWEDVDFDRRLLWVTRSKTPEGESREIPLTQRLYELLESNRQEEGPVFVYKDRPIKTIARAWKAAIRRAGIRYVRFHDLRHCFATRLLEAGVMQEVRKALMGHSSGERVHSTYVHIELPAKRDAIVKLEQWVHRQQPQLNGGHHANT